MKILQNYLVCLMPDGLTPKSKDMIIKAVFSEVQLMQGVTFTSGPQWTDKEKLRKVPKRTHVGYVYIDPKDQIWKIIDISGAALTELKEFLKGNEGTSYELCTSFIQKHLI